MDNKNKRMKLEKFLLERQEINKRAIKEGTFEKEFYNFDIIYKIIDYAEDNNIRDVQIKNIDTLVRSIGYSHGTIRCIQYLRRNGIGIYFKEEELISFDTNQDLELGSIIERLAQDFICEIEEEREEENKNK